MQCMSHHNSHEETRAQCFTLLLGGRSFSSKDRASLSVLFSVVSVGIVSSSAPLALEIEGLKSNNTLYYYFCTVIRSGYVGVVRISHLTHVSSG